MKPWIVPGAIAFVLAASFSAIALAGFKPNLALEIEKTSTTTGAAGGDLAYVRNGNGSQWDALSCGITATPSGATVNCMAANATNNDYVHGVNPAIRCQSASPFLVQAVQAINGDSYLKFWWSGTTCTRITVDNGSWHAPKAP